MWRILERMRKLPRLLLLSALPALPAIGALGGCRHAPAPRPPESPVTPARLQGPAQSLEAYCGGQAGTAPEGPVYRCEGEAEPLLQGSPAPFREARLVLRRERALVEEPVRAGLALRTEVGWFLLEDAIPRRVRTSSFLDEGGLVGAELVPQSLGPPILAVRLQRTRSYDGASGERGARFRQSFALYCGIGGSGAASCTPPLLVGCEQLGKGRGGQLHLEPPRDGVLRIGLPPGVDLQRVSTSCDRGGVAPQDLSRLLGSHPLRFP